MTTNRDTDTAPTTAVLQLFLHHWAHQAGAFSALPDAPVVADRPRRGAVTSLARRLTGRPSARHPDCALTCRPTPVTPLR